MDIDTESTTLQPRRQPRQERSRQRVDQILDAVSELLVTGSFDAITTNLIAEKAGIPVGSIYQFFPNKFAVINALVERYLEQIGEIHKTSVRREEYSRPWEELIDQSVDVVSRYWSSEPALPFLWGGIQNTPELREAYAEANKRSRSYNRRFLDHILPHIDEERRRIIAQVMVSLSERLFTLSVTVDQADHDRIVEELKINFKAYIGFYVEQGTDTAGGNGNGGL